MSLAGRPIARRPLLQSLVLAGAAVFVPLQVATDLPRAHAQAQASLYVYLHTEAKSSVLESALKNRLPALQITVFGRFADFEDAINARSPDGVLGLQPLLSSQKIPVALQGLKDNLEKEPYVLLSSGSPLDGNLSGRVIGVVDLLGRTATQDFVGRLLKTPDLKFKRVTKIEDLLPLLQFSAAEGVLVPAGAVKGLSERSRLPLRVRSMDDVLVGLPAVGVLNARARALIVSQVQALDPETNRLLGVDRWRIP